MNKVFLVKEVYTKQYYVLAETQAEALNNCDENFEPEPEFISGSAFEASKSDIEQAKRHEGDDDYVLWDIKGNEVLWSTLIT